MIKKSVFFLSLVLIFSGCKKEADVAGLLIGKWNYNASIIESKREAANDCDKKSSLEFGSGGAIHAETYTDENPDNTCQPIISSLKSYAYNAASRLLTLNGAERRVYKVASISQNKLVLQSAHDDGTLAPYQYEYIR